MRRTTVLLDDDLADRLDYERRRRNQSTTAIVREALTEYLAGSKPASTPVHHGFFNLGRSGYHDTSEKFDEILAKEWLPDLMRDSFSDQLPKKNPGAARRKKKRSAAPRRGR